ncbi:hypothetical protein ACFLRU_04525 [Bacteroidota bacterium]
MVQVLRGSKCFAFFYGDSVSEKDFYIKNFKVSFSEDLAVFEFDLMKLLDFSLFEETKFLFDTFIIEDEFLQKKIISFLKEHKEIRFFKLQINTKTLFKRRIARIKFQEKKVQFLLF